MDEVISAIPHSAQAEQAVLGSMLIDISCVKDVVSKLKKDDFYLELNQKVFNTIYSMFLYAKPIDVMTVYNEMDAAGDGSEDTKNYLVSLMEITPTAANAMEYVNIVKEKSTMRSLAQVAQEVADTVKEGGANAAEMLDAAEQKIYAIRNGKSVKGMVDIGVVLQEVMANLAEITTEGGRIPGITTGFPTLDRKTNGLNKTDLIILAARPAMGKTSFALNIARNAAQASGKTVAIFSLEMSRDQLTSRMLASEGLIESSRIATGDLKESDWTKIGEASASLGVLHICINDDPMISVAEMKAECRRIENLGLIVIDYLQLMTSAGGKPTSGENRQQVVSNISRMLKIMAKDLQVPVLCLSQLSRANEKREDKRPMLSDLRESGSVEQDADIVLFIYRDDYYKRDEAPTNIAEVMIAKNRHGETGKVDLRWLPEYTTFCELETRYGEG